MRSVLNINLRFALVFLCCFRNFNRVKITTDCYGNMSGYEITGNRAVFIWVTDFERWKVQNDLCKWRWNKQIIFTGLNLCPCVLRIMYKMFDGEQNIIWYTYLNSNQTLIDRYGNILYHCTNIIHNTKRNEHGL